MERYKVIVIKKYVFDLDGKEVKSEGEIPLEVIIKISKYLHQNR